MTNIKNYHKIKNSGYNISLKKLLLLEYTKKQKRQIIDLFNRMQILFLLFSLNHHFIYEDILVNHIKTITNVYNLPSNSSY